MLFKVIKAVGALFLGLTANTCSAGGCCGREKGGSGHDCMLMEFPIPQQDEILDFAYGTMNDKANCTNFLLPDLNSVKFLYYDAEGPQEMIGEPKSILNPDLPVTIISHGWKSCPESPEVATLISSYLVLNTSNVIAVDWSEIASTFYPSTVRHVPRVAKLVAAFIAKIAETRGSASRKFHLIGHSLGAHLSGLAGKVFYEERGQMLDRITGLDPALPWYWFNSQLDRLASTDAYFVDIVHSNSGIAGYKKRCGSVDYYLNCGTVQPGCNVARSDVQPYSLLSKIMCAHSRSAHVWSEAISTNEFKGKECLNCPKTKNCDTGNSEAKYFSMGSLDAPDKSVYIPTRGESPYAMGCGAYPDEECY